ncbi:MAG: type II toxin-antitoxin system mRNA interferase toxin, RelE/StbE family [Candidatus Woykebacteria bacterium]
MQIKVHKTFVKNYQKRIIHNPKLVSKFQTRLKQFVDDPDQPTLKDHKLIGKLSSYRAFSISGDVRVVYKVVGNELWLYDIGTHNQVY